MSTQDSPQLPGKIYAKLERLFLSPGPESWALSAHLIKGLGCPPEALLRFFEVFSRHFLQDFLDRHHYRHASLSLLDRYPYGILYQKLNEFFDIPQLKAKVECKQIHLALLVLPHQQNRLDNLELSISGFQANLYAQVRVHFEIGKKPLLFDADLRPINLWDGTKASQV